MINLNREELAWAAGFFDGEGNIRAYIDKRSEEYYLQIQIGQVLDDYIFDHPYCEVLEKFKDAVQLGRINGPYEYKSRPRKQPVLQYSANGFEACQYIIAALWPWLSDNKKWDYMDAITKYRQNKKLTGGRGRSHD